MSVQADPNEHIRRYLRDYLGLARPPGYAVMVRGPWGIGKTFLIREILAEQFPDDAGYIYVSLYGVSSPEEIDSTILASMYPILGTKTAKVTGRLLNAGMKYLRIEGALVATDIINRTSGAVYVFDDIERSSMKPDAIFGYINQFVEHEGCRVVLVANETELEKAEGYRTKREKLVGQTLEAKSAVSGALATFLGEITDAETRRFLASIQDDVVSLYELGEVNNLRVLRQTIWDFERFYRSADPTHRKNDQAFLRIAQLLFALSFEFKLGRIVAEDLLDRQASWIASAMRGGEQTPFKVACDRYQGVDLHDTTLSDELLVEMLVSGVVDADLIRRDVQASSWFVDMGEEPSWRTLWYRFTRPDDVVDAALRTLHSELAEYRYREPGEILHVFGLLLKLSEVGLVPDDQDTVLLQAKAYIDALRSQEQLPPLRSDSFLEDIRHGAWGGLGITSAGTPRYGELYAYLQVQRANAAAQKLPAYAERLLEELGSDPDLFCRRLVGPSGEGSDLIEGPVLAHLAPKAFFDAFRRQSAAVQFRVVQCLMSRHGQSGYAGGLEEERPWVRSLRDLMRAEAQAANPICRERLTEYAEWISSSLEGDDGSEPVIVSGSEVPS